MLLQSLRALCLAPGGPGSNWKYLEELVRSTRVFGGLVCGFQIDLHFANTVESFIMFQCTILILAHDLTHFQQH